MHALPKEHLHCTDDDGDDQDLHGVLQRIDQGGQLQNLAAQEVLSENRQHVAEEAAGEKAEDKGTDTKIPAQPEHIAQGVLGIVLLDDDVADHKEDDAVGDIREHEAKEGDEKPEDEGGGVDALIGRQRRHLRDHIDRIHPLGILEQGRRGLPLRRRRKLVGAGEVVQPADQFLLLLPDGPALHKEYGAVRLACLDQFLPFPGKTLQVLCRGPGHVPELNGAEREGFQGRVRQIGLLPVA